MGQDLAKKAVPTFVKAWDRERAALKRRDLLTQIPDPPKLALLVQLDVDVRLERGQLVTLHREGEVIIVQHDLAQIGSVVDAPQQLDVEMQADGLCLQAEILELHSEAGVAEVKLK